MYTSFLRTLLVLGLLGITVPVQSQRSPLRQPRSVPIDGYVARVNDQIITRADVLKFAAPLQRRYQKQYTGRELKAKLKEAFATARKRLVQNALIQEAFKDSEAQLPRRMVDQRIDRIIQKRFQNDRSQFLSALANDQLTPEQWRTRIRKQLIVRLLKRERIQRHIQVSPKEVWTYYQENKWKYTESGQANIQMIMLPRDPNPEASDASTQTTNTYTRQQAENLRNRLQEDPERFAEIARQHSSGPYAAQGGKWGWTETDRLIPQITQKVNSLPSKKISPVISNAEQFFIVRVIDRKSEDSPSFEELFDQIENRLREQKAEELLTDWTEELRERYYVKVY